MTAPAPEAAVDLAALPPSVVVPGIMRLARPGQLRAVHRHRAHRVLRGLLRTHQQEGGAVIWLVNALLGAGTVFLLLFGTRISARIRARKEGQ